MTYPDPARPGGVATIVTTLAERARQHPDRYFVRFREADLTYAAFETRTRSLAAGLRRHRVAGLGGGAVGGPVGAVGPGATSPDGGPHVVPTLLPNCADAAVLWFAANRAGAVWAPLNTEFRGAGLAHAINLTGSRDLVVDHPLVDAVLEIAGELENIERLIVRGGPAPASGRFATLSLDALEVDDDGVPPAPPPSSAAPSLLIYTSGTTGDVEGV